MTKEEFVEQMQDVLQTDADLTMVTTLNELDEWDSLAMMATMAFLDKNFGAKVSIKDFREMQTVGDIAARAGI